MTRSFVTSSIVSAFVLIACGGSEVVVGKTDTSDQKLQTTKDGGATGNGTTCSWANTSVYEQYGKSAPVPTYALGDEFNSIDGCNECTCAANGIMCTIKTCSQRACDLDAQVCPDGSSVGRSGPNCTFTCPGTVACTDDAKKCPDGTYVGRVAPTCEFKSCSGNSDPPGACTADAMECPDGTFVGRDANCQFVCPAASCEQIELAASNRLHKAASANLGCTKDEDCELVGISTNCNDNCTAPMAKSGDVFYKSEIDSINADICPGYAKQGCKVIAPACVPSLQPRCVDNQCK